MPELSTLIAFTGAAFLLGITPGPDIIYVIIRGAVQGGRAGVVAAAGLTTGLIGHTALCVIGVSAVIAASAVAFTVIKVAGAAYLVFLGVGMMKAGWRGAAMDMGGGNNGIKALSAIYRQTILMNLLNPKVGLFFLAFLPQFVDPQAGPAPPQLLVLGVIFMAVSFVVMGAAGLAGGQVRRWLERRQRAGQWLNISAGGVLIALGVHLAFASR